MTADDFYPEHRPGRPVWLVTLADLALLLLGFVVLVQATGNRAALAAGLRERFGESAALPVAAAATDFSPGSAALADPRPLAAWARDALADPRVTVTVVAAGDGGDALNAADRARVVTGALVAAGLPARRLLLATSPVAGRRVTLTLSFTGNHR